MQGEIHAIVNPVSGNGKARQQWPQVARRLHALGYPIREYTTSGPGDATRIARQLVRAGAREILAVGGDGTVNEIVNGFFERGVSLAPESTLSVLPCGTGRDFSRNLGIRSIEHALEVLERGRIAQVDVGRITYREGDEDRDRYFVNVADVGLGAETAARINRTSKALGGFFSYLLGAAFSIVVFRGHAARVAVDGRTLHDGPLGMVVMANGRFHAGGMLMAPSARIDDGLFDILVLRHVPKWVLLGSLLPRVYRGKHLGHPAVFHCQGRTVEVTAAGRLPFEVDGEQPGTTDLTATVLPQVLRVRMPAPAGRPDTRQALR